MSAIGTAPRVPAPCAPVTNASVIAHHDLDHELRGRCGEIGDEVTERQVPPKPDAELASVGRHAA